MSKVKIHPAKHPIMGLMNKSGSTDRQKGGDAQP
jgi:hypothetical protein